MDYSSSDFCNINNNNINHNIDSGEKSEFQRPTSPSERESVSLPPLNAMAFTIPLDEPKVKWKGKSFSIKDAIRKFAPPKPDTIEKQRPVKLKSCESEKGNSSKHKEKDGKGKLSIQDPEGHVSDSASYLIQRMLNDESQQLQCDGSEDEESERSNLTRSDNKRKVKDSVLNGSKKSPSINGCIGEKDSGVCDDKSESGTYTLDKNDPVVEEARRRIDQVFGVPENSDAQLFPSSTTNVLDPSTSPLASITALKSLISSSKADLNLFSSSATINRSPSDHRRSSDSKPPIISSSFLNSRANRSRPSSNHGSDNESTSNYPVKPQRKHCYLSDDKNTEKDQCSTWARRNSMDRGSIRERTHSFTKRTSKSPSPSPTHSSALRSPATSKVYTNSSPVNLTPSPNRDKPRRSQSNHRTGSDFDLGDYDDANSIKSDASNASTEPSSGSGKGKSSDTASLKGSSMRFNRAFALRRAKLGMDTLGVPLNLTAERQAHVNSILESRSNPRSTPSPTFNRNDGGRFSLRLLNNNKKSTRKPPVGNPNHWSRQSAQTGSVTGNGRQQQQPVINKLRTLSISSDVENGCSSPGQSPSRSIRSIPIQKSSSFHNPKDNSSLSTARREVATNGYRTLSPFQATKRFFTSKASQMTYSNGTKESKNGSNNTNSSSILNGIHHNLSSSLSSHDYTESPRRGSMSESLNEAKLSRCPGSSSNRIAPAYTKSMLTNGLSSTPSRVYPGENGFPKATSGGTPSKELSALDKLVISAIFQLSHKLRHNLRGILDNERLKYPPASETRLMIEDLLPQVTNEEKRMFNNDDISRDLSSILKNLKKVEQSYELVTLLLANANGNTHSISNLSSPGGDNDFYGDTIVSCDDFQDEY